MSKLTSLSIDKKLIFLVMVVSVVAISTSAFLSFNSATEILTERVGDQLISESTLRGDSIVTIFETRQKEIQILSTNKMIQKLVSELNNLPDDSDFEKQLQEKRSDFLVEVRAFQELVGFSIGFEDVQILGKDGQVFFSLGRLSPDTNYKQDPRFLKGLTASFVDFEHAPSGGSKMVVVLPIFENDDKKSEPIGVVITKMRTEKVDEILLNRSGLGDSGEVYLVNNNYFIISESRFISDAPFNVKVETLAVRKCLEENIEVNNVYADYRGNQIYGSSYCAKDLGFVLLAEIDVAETLDPVFVLQDKIFLTGIFVTLGMGTAAFFISKLISRPIVKLKNATNEIARGNYAIRTNIKSKDEIGQLSSSFDAMANKIQESLVTIRQKEGVIKQQAEVLLQFSEQSAEYCVCMVDIIKSTAITSKLSDLQTSEFYELFLNYTAKIVTQFNGLVVKNIGDALLFYFPKTSSKNSKDIRNALDCCLTMAESNADLSSKMKEAGLPRFDYRISATYGSVRVAKIATSSVDDIFGSTVNRCAKINRFALPNTLIIGSDLYEHVKSFDGYNFAMTKLSPLSDEHIYAVYLVSRISV